MATLNKAMVIGYLGADPELRHLDSGTAVCNFSMATNEKWKDRDGEAQESTEWHRIVVWGKQGENCNEYLAKGRQAYVEGRIETREWEDKDGNRRWTTEIVAQRVLFMSSEGDGGKRRNEPPPRDEQSGPPDTHDDDDIPFR